MKTRISTACCRIILAAGSLALFSTSTHAASLPEITSPVEGSVIEDDLIRVLIDANGIYDTKSVEVRSNGKLVGMAKPTSVLGHWSFGNGRSFAIMDGPHGAICDYHPDSTSSMYTMDGEFKTASQFVGTFDHWGGTHSTGNVEINLSFSNTGLLTAVCKADAPLGNFTVQGGTTSGASYVFRWNDVQDGTYKLRVRTSYEDSNGDMQIANSPAVNVTVKIPKAPEIVVQQPKGKGLTDGKSRKSFGSVKLSNKKGATRTFTIKNRGNARLKGLKIYRKGNHPKDFVLRQPVKTSLAPGASTTFKVVFKPKAKGARNAKIRIRSNDANEDPFVIKVAGTGKK